KDDWTCNMLEHLKIFCRNWTNSSSSILPAGPRRIIQVCLLIPGSVITTAALYRTLDQQAGCVLRELNGTAARSRFTLASVTIAGFYSEYRHLISDYRTTHRVRFYCDS